MKRIIVFSYDFPPNTGGIARLTENIALHLALNTHKDYEIIVLTKKVMYRKPVNDRVRIIEVNPSYKGRLFESYKYLSSLDNKDQTIVICGLWWPEGFVAELAGIKNIFILTHAAEIRPDNTWFRKKIWIPIIAKLILTKAKGVIANSEFTSSISKQLAPKANVYCLPLAVDHKLFIPTGYKRSTNCLNIITITRIHLWKGLDTILNAIIKLPPDIRKNIQWEIAGKGPDESILKKMVSESPIKDQVKFLGFVDDEELPKLYSSADLFALCTRADENSSNIEGFGLVFLESQACGTPTIGTHFGGIPSAIDHNNGGWLINNEQELTTLIKRLYYNRNLIEDQSKLARTRVENFFTWNYYISNIMKITGISSC